LVLLIIWFCTFESHSLLGKRMDSYKKLPEDFPQGSKQKHSTIQCIYNNEYFKCVWL